MSNLIDIHKLHEQFEASNPEELKSLCQSQHAVIESYRKEIEVLKFKNGQLETMLSNKTVDLVTELTPEEKICIEQIHLLNAVSSQRALTLDEVKRLDLLIKNLKLIRDESTIVVDSRISDRLGEAELVALATGQQS